MKLERTELENNEFESFKQESLVLESFHLSWKELMEVGKFSIQIIIIFPTSFRTFQFHFELSNFSFFPTALSNYMLTFSRLLWVISSLLLATNYSNFDLLTNWKNFTATWKSFPVHICCEIMDYQYL